MKQVQNIFQRPNYSGLNKWSLKDGKILLILWNFFLIHIQKDQEFVFLKTVFISKVPFEVHIIFKHHLNNRKDLVSYMFLGKSEQTAIVLIAARQLVEQIRLTVPELSRADWLSLVVRTRRYKELHDMKESFWKIKVNQALRYFKTARYAFYFYTFLSTLMFYPEILTKWILSGLHSGCKYISCCLFFTGKVQVF